MVQIMGIINTTEHSIDADQRVIDDPLIRARRAFWEGAHWVDIGGQATNPWAPEGDAEAEWESIATILPRVLNEFPGRVSLDTFRPEVAENALKLGSVILNDVTGFHNPDMIELASRFGTLCIVSHLPFAAEGIVARAHAPEFTPLRNETDGLAELLVRRRQMINAGIPPDRIILDPGIGFGKTSALNRRLLEFGRLVLDANLLAGIDAKVLDEPRIKVMIGHSQKRMIAENFGGNKTDTVANLRAAIIAIQAGASYLRVHEVAAHYELARSRFRPS